MEKYKLVQYIPALLAISEGYDAVIGATTQQCFDELVKLEFVERDEQHYQLTELGQRWVDALLALPVPMHPWLYEPPAERPPSLAAALELPDLLFGICERREGYVLVELTLVRRAPQFRCDVHPEPLYVDNEGYTWFVQAQSPDSHPRYLRLKKTHVPEDAPYEEVHLELYRLSQHKKGSPTLFFDREDALDTIAALLHRDVQRLERRAREAQRQAQESRSDSAIREVFER